jgi:hypothetical protein
MDESLLQAFLFQVLAQCNYLLRAANDANSALEKRDVEGVFYALQNLLDANANISKALWGQGGKLSEQRKDLRKSIEVNDSSPLHEVLMRNNCEHFDERLDRWWRESSRHNIIDLSIVDSSSNSFLAGAAVIDQFRVFDPDTRNLTFWGQEFNIQDLINEVHRILPKVMARLHLA